MFVVVVARGGALDTNSVDFVVVVVLLMVVPMRKADTTI